MKKFLMCLVLVMFLSISIFAHATAESVTITGPTRCWNNVYKITFAIVTDANGALTATATSFDVDGWVFMATTDPGTALTDNYDIGLVDSDSADVFGLSLNDRDTSTSEQASPLLDGTDYGERFVDSTLTVDVTGNSNANGSVTLVVYFHR